MSGGSSHMQATITATCTLIGVGLAAYWSVKLQRYALRMYRLNTKLAQYRDLLVPGRQQLTAIKNHFRDQMEAGLAKDAPLDFQHMLMLPTFVTKLPTGMETGSVYAIDLGGTNFRVSHVEFSSERSKVLRQETQEVAIPLQKYTGTGTALFDFLAVTLKEFMDEHGGSSAPNGGDPVVGFCFSFALNQTALNEGKLLTWTKGFTCTGVVGEDPVALLSQALVRAGRPCRIAAVINDTVGVLAAHRYLEPSTAIGIIVGTGTNACYVESVQQLSKWTPPKDTAPNAQTLVNMEWGCFDSPALPRCPEDADLDTASTEPGANLFEKLISGLYMGEVARRILFRMAANDMLFGDHISDQDARAVLMALAEPGILTTAHLAEIVQDDDRSLASTGCVLERVLAMPHRLAPYSIRSAVRSVCESVALRSATLVACSLDAILSHKGWGLGQGQVTLAFDGGVYDKFERYRDMVASVLRQLLGEAAFGEVRLELSKGGSCLGAAVLAAAAVAPVSTWGQHLAYSASGTSVPRPVSPAMPASTTTAAAVPRPVTLAAAVTATAAPVAALTPVAAAAPPVVPLTAALAAAGAATSPGEVAAAAAAPSAPAPAPVSEATVAPLTAALAAAVAAVPPSPEVVTVEAFEAPACTVGKDVPTYTASPPPPLAAVTPSLPAVANGVTAAQKVDEVEKAHGLGAVEQEAKGLGVAAPHKVMATDIPRASARPTPDLSDVSVNAASSALPADLSDASVSAAADVPECASSKAARVESSPEAPPAASNNGNARSSLEAKLPTASASPNGTPSGALKRKKKSKK
mmetsp:Transcript_19097/g.32760  ORF Transcript_19097/g.32760 Transcript_19097/m.32760 type:complete len:807 (-) Transcript_19097:874-3294(-)